MFLRTAFSLLLFFLPLCGWAGFSPAIPYNAEGPNPVGYLSIGKDRGIDQSTYLYVKFALDEFKQKKVPFIVLHLDTPGGEVFASMKIADLLQKIDADDHIPVVAFIDNWAISAGAMLAYSCRYIGTVKTGSMGAAEPVTSGQDGKMESASEKVNSALRAEFANLASSYGRNPWLAEAMVDKDLIVVRRKGEIIKLDQENQIRSSDQIISKPGKLLTLNAEQLVEYGVADFSVASALTQEPFFAKIPQLEYVTYQNWKITFFSFLSHPLIAALLFMGLMLGIYMEVQHPGFGFPAILGLSCLSLVLLSAFADHAIHWLEVIALVTGLGLLCIELFLIPGFGVTGILGIVLILVGLMTLMTPRLPTFSLSWNIGSEVILQRLAYLSAALIATVAFILTLGRRFAWRSPFILKEVESPPLPSEFPPIGAKGEAYTQLRPSGKVKISGQLYDAISEWEFIEKGTPIIILRQEGNKVVVCSSPSS